MMRFAVLPAVVLLLTLGACSRAVSIGSDPSPTYAVEVHNAMANAVNVFYVVGTTERVLGNVAPAGTERFVIAGSDGPRVRIVARDPATGQGFGPYDLLLGEGETKRVVIRP